MGTCLSCCSETNSPTRNGHSIPRNASLAKPVSLHRTSQDPPTTGSAQALNYPLEPVLAGCIDTPRDVHLNFSAQQMSAGYKNSERLTPAAQSRLSASKHSKADSSESPSRASDDAADVKLHALFDEYKDPLEDSILADGIERLCDDLDVRPDEFRVLVLAWTFGAETMCRFTRAEFVGGCRTIGADSVDSIRAHFPDMLDTVRRRDIFKELYRWAFRFALEADVGQRTLPLDMAVGMWRVVFAQNQPPMLAHWLEFLERPNSVRGITKDTWDMFLNFLESVDDDLLGYDDTEAWPSLFDDFVEWFREQQGSAKSTRKMMD